MENDFSSTPSPWTRPWFVVVAAAAILVVAAAVVIAVWPSHHSSEPSGPAVALSSVPAASVPGPASPTAVLPTAVPTAAPADVHWELVGQSAVPVSTSAGPHTVSGGVAAGYAHTPEGALIAAAQLAVRAGLSAGRSSWEPTIEQQFMPSADRDRLLAELRAAPQNPAGVGELSPLAGFAYLSYSPDTAVVSLVYRSAAQASVYQAVTTTLRWSGGDWRMVTPPSGSWLSVSHQTTDLSGVIPWGAR